MAGPLRCPSALLKSIVSSQMPPCTGISSKTLKDRQYGIQGGTEEDSEVLGCMIVDKFIALSALPHLPQAGAHIGRPFSALTFFCALGELRRTRL